MATPFENFVNTELPKKLGVSDVPASGNFPAGYSLQTTGTGLLIEAVPGGAGVPYTGATADLDLGAHNLLTQSGCQLNADNISLTFGAANDVGMKFDGTNWVFNSNIVGTTQCFDFKGFLNVNSAMVTSNFADITIFQHLAADTYKPAAVRIYKNYTGTGYLYGTLQTLQYSPASDSVNGVSGFGGTSLLGGTKNIGSVLGGFFSIGNASTTSGNISTIIGCKVAMVLGYTQGANNYPNTRVVTGNVDAFKVECTVAYGSPITVNGDVTGMRIQDLNTIYASGGIYYGIKQEGATALNKFDGDIEIGAGQGLILTDKTLTTRHRVELDNGVLTISGVV